MIKFIEQVIIVCDQLNKKSNCQSSTSTQHPVFTLWGEPLEICRQLLSKHQLTHLNSQHFILATDELISLLPLNLLNSSTLIGATSPPLPPSSSCSSNGVSSNLLNQHLFTWCTVDPTVGKIIPSVQLQRSPSSSFLKTRDGQPPFIDRLLHFCTVRSNNNSNNTTTTNTCNNSSNSNTNNGNRNVFNVCQSELANTKSDKLVSSMLNTCCLSTPILVSNISSAHGIRMPIQQQVDNGQKENHPLDSNNFNVINYHPLNNNTISSPPPIFVTNIPNNDKRISTTINAINHCTSNPPVNSNEAIMSPTTDRQLVDGDAFQSSTNHCQQQKRKSQPFLNATNISLNLSAVRFPHPQDQSLPATLSQPPPPPPHQRFYPSNTMHLDPTIHSQAHVNCVPSGSILVPYTVVSTVTDCTTTNNNKCNVSSHILNGSQQKDGFPSPSVIQKLSTSNILHTTTSISHAPQHVHSVSDKVNSRNANQGFKPPVRPNSYWPVPDEISVDKLQTNHDNDSRKEVSVVHIYLIISH
ncbi:unnamed protein product [Trichobilharzia regenti]|nr:unnamed protein product [Trichobilharzia regenti]